MFYLPVSKRCIDDIIGQPDSAGRIIEDFSSCEIAALLFLQQLPGKQITHAKGAEVLLAQLIEICNTHTLQKGTVELASLAKELIETRSLIEGVELADKLRISYCDAATIRQKSFLNSDNLWDFDFARRKRQANTRPVKVRHLTLGAEQSRIYREIKSQQNENLHIQGYAGTGKTTLIQSLLPMYNNAKANLLFLGETRRPLDALKLDSSQRSRISIDTFAGLAKSLIPNDYTNPVLRKLRQQKSTTAPTSDTELLRLLNIPDDNSASSAFRIRAIRATLFKYCHSADSIPFAYAKNFSQAGKAAIVEHTITLWKLFSSPPPDRNTPLFRGYHYIKLAALNEWTIPDTYTHIFVDECHNISNAMQQILNRSPQSVISMGDDYQNLQGKLTKLPDVLRLREMTHSIRSGYQIEEVINPMIAAHPNPVKNRFKGNPGNNQEIKYYKNSVVPESASLILVRDFWGLFEWSQRLSAADKPIRMISNMNSLNMFVADCIELYTNGVQPRHGELFRFNSWSDVYQTHHQSKSFGFIHRMLEHGYHYRDWEKTSSLFRATENDSTSHTISMIEHARNLEFNCVMITPGVVRTVSPETRSADINTVYTACTRSVRRLLLPEGLRHWIEDIPTSLKPMAAIQSS